MQTLTDQNLTKRGDAAVTELAATLGSVALGTAALVGIHHYYRRQKHPEARWEDYWTGLRTQGQALQASTPPLTRLKYAAKQARSAWQQAYRDDKRDSRDKAGTDTFAALHTTTQLTRPIRWVSGVASMPHQVALTEESDNGFGVVGIAADRQLVWQTTMPERVHDIVVQPPRNTDATHRHVVVMGRRPSEYFWVLDTACGAVQFAIKADPDRHFYGHACYSLDGKWLYVTENDTISLEGKVGIYEVDKGYQKAREFDSHGIGPHELIMHPDGETLIIANGGIKTEQASREELNLDSMRPSLVYLNRYDGTRLEQITPEHNQMSIRHLAMHDNGTVMIGIQFQGEKHLNVPLVLTHQRGDARFVPLMMPSNQWQRFHQYIASVAVDSTHNILCVTTPIGGCAALFDLNTGMLIDSVSLPDCAGASVIETKNNDTENQAQSGFVISDGQGQLTRVHTPDRLSVITDSLRHKMSFDNHLQAL